MDALARRFDFEIETSELPVGGHAYDLTGSPLPNETMQEYKKADAILFGAVGGPKWDHLEKRFRPESALLELRSELELFASFRPVRTISTLLNISSLKSFVMDSMIGLRCDVVPGPSE